VYENTDGQKHFLAVGDPVDEEIDNPVIWRMVETTTGVWAEMKALRSPIDASHDRSTRATLLEHARMGRSVVQGGPGNTFVEVTPAEIFARYGFDEFGRPLPDAE
jgi:hypothetical protein